MKKFVFVLVALAASASLSEAQTQRPRAFTKRSVTKAEYAQAIKNNDRKVLNVDCMDVVEAMNKAFGETLRYQFIDCPNLADYFVNLMETPLPQVRMRFGRIMPDGSVDLDGFSRDPLVGEMALFDNQAGIYPVSLLCGNITPDRLPAPVFTSSIEKEVKEERPPTQVQAPSQPGPIAQAVAQTQQPEEPLAQEKVEEISPSGQSWLSRHKKWLIPAIIAGGVGAAVVANSGKKTTVTQEVTIIR